MWVEDNSNNIKPLTYDSDICETKKIYNCSQKLWIRKANAEVWSALNYEYCNKLLTHWKPSLVPSLRVLLKMFRLHYTYSWQVIHTVMFAGACGDLVKLVCEQMCAMDVNQLPVLGWVFGLCGSSCELLSLHEQSHSFCFGFNICKISKRALATITSTYCNGNAPFRTINKM